MPPPSYISRTTMRTATMKMSVRTKRPTTERRIRFAQDGRVAFAVIVHLRERGRRGREGDWRVVVEIEAESDGKVPGAQKAAMRTSGENENGQRGRGRRGGRAVSGRGRMRKRGLRGGGTLRRKSPQQGQRPSSAMGPVASARSQWPRRSHIGLMHCTVKPGRYCIGAPSVAASFVARVPLCDRSSLGRPGQTCWRGFCR
jgi:hypothetical protein